MIRILPLQKAHLDHVRADFMAGFSATYLTEAIKDQLEQSMSFAAIDGEEVICCAGVVEYWPGRAAAWAMISDKIHPRRFLTVHRAIKQFLDESGYGRIEAATALEFCNGHKWLEMLGFKKETEVMKGYLPDGRDASMYVRGI